MGATSTQSTLETKFSTFGFKQHNTSILPSNSYDTHGSLTCLTVSITEYDSPLVKNRSGAEKVSKQIIDYDYSLTSIFERIIICLKQQSKSVASTVKAFTAESL